MLEPGVSSDARPHDILIVGARVIDPETGFDKTANVAIRDKCISYIGAEQVVSVIRVDATGLVLAPGFIDLHSHALDVVGMNLQAFDGVTTALELEGGAMPVRETLAWMSSRGRPLNFGASASWSAARMHVVDGLPIRTPAQVPGYRVPRDARPINPSQLSKAAPSRSERRRIEQLLAGELKEGALGIGVLLGYMPWATNSELSGVFDTAAAAEVPVFVHSRSMAQYTTPSAVDAVLELLSLAEQSGAHLHLCHLNSTSGKSIHRVLEMLTSARLRGVSVTTEAYPYGAGSTAIGADFLAPENLAGIGLAPDSITYVATGERVVDESRLAAIRKEDPGGACIVHILEETDSEDLQLLRLALAYPGAAVVSDSGLVEYAGGELRRQEAEAALLNSDWPLPKSVMSHPRSAGAFARSVRWLALDSDEMSLADALAKCSLVPANIIRKSVPAMSRKGRLQVDADADIVALDLLRFRDTASYETLAPSAGVVHLFVLGEQVIHEGTLLSGARPGRPIVRSHQKAMSCLKE